MTGEDLELWARTKYGRLERLAVDLGTSVATLYAWFRKPQLDRPKLLRLADIGCQQAAEEARQAHRSAVGAA